MRDPFGKHRLRAPRLAAAVLLAIACGAAQGRPPAPLRQPFDRTLSLQGVTFRVICANDSSLGRLVIVPSGPATGARPVSREVDGTVTGAEVADLDADGSPELYVYATSAGSGSYGSVLAWVADRRNALSEVRVPPISANAEASQGYQGHDRFAVVEGSLVRRFPVYRPGDPNARPTGGTRELHYGLVPSGSGWALFVHRIVEN